MRPLIYNVAGQDDDDDDGNDDAYMTAGTESD